MTNSKKLRLALAEEKILVAPGGYDSFTMGLAESTGFKVGYLGGYSISASRTRTPDWGIATMTDYLDTAFNAAASVSIPLICDIDQGFGAVSNFVYAINRYERAGVAGVHFEDQAFPKKCGAQGGRKVISVEENVKKIKAAVETREDPNFVLIARSDAQAVDGFDGVKRRFEAYLNAGADYVLYVEYENEKQLMEMGREFPGRIFCCAGDAYWCPTYYLPFQAYYEYGYKCLIYFAIMLSAGHKAIRDMLETMQREGQLTYEYHKKHCYNLDENNKITKLEDYWRAIRDKYEML